MHIRVNKKDFNSETLERERSKDRSAGYNYYYYHSYRYSLHNLSFFLITVLAAGVGGT